MVVKASSEEADRKRRTEQVSLDPLKDLSARRIPNDRKYDQIETRKVLILGDTSKFIIIDSCLVTVPLGVL